MWISLAKSLPLQILGTSSIAMSMLMVSRTYGPAVQGEFAYFRSLAEFWAPLVMLGAPQSLLYFVRSGCLPLRWSIAVATAYAPAIFVVTLLGVYVSHALHESPAISVPYVVLALCAACFGLSSNIRSVVLASGQHVLFGILSCLPQFACLLLIVCVPREYDTNVTYFYAAGWIVSGALAGTWGAAHLWRNTTSWRIGVALRPFFRYGLATCVPSVLSSASLAITYMLVERSLGKAAVGNVSIALMILQTVITPVILIAPTLFYTWISSSQERRERDLRNRQFALINRCTVCYALLCCVGQWLVLDAVIAAVLGSGFKDAERAASIIMFGYLPACLEAASIPLLYAASRPGAAAGAAAIKSAFIVVGQVLLWPFDLSVVAMVWALAQWAGWLALVVYLDVLGVCRVSHALGIAPAGARRARTSGRLVSPARPSACTRANECSHFECGVNSP